MSYSSLKKLSEVLDSKIIQAIAKNTKENFSNNEQQITVALGIAGEIYDIISTIDEEIYILNKDLSSLILPIKSYYGNLLNDYKLVNSYMLYDSFKIDLVNLKSFLKQVLK